MSKQPEPLNQSHVAHVLGMDDWIDIKIDAKTNLKIYARKQGYEFRQRIVISHPLLHKIILGLDKDAKANYIGWLEVVLGDAASVDFSIDRDIAIHTPSIEQIIEALYRMGHGD